MCSLLLYEVARFLLRVSRETIFVESILTKIRTDLRALFWVKTCDVFTIFSG